MLACCAIRRLTIKMAIRACVCLCKIVRMRAMPRFAGNALLHGEQLIGFFINQRFLYYI